MIPPPASAHPLRLSGPRTTVYQYHDMEGKVISYVSRHEGPEGKTFLPWTYGSLNGKRAWHPKRGHPPLSLYNLDMLAHLPADWDVFIVEGEKAANVLNKKLRKENYAAFAMTWPGGASNTEYADWRPLAGRSVILWPDADREGRNAMAHVAGWMHVVGAQIIGWISITSLPDGFDAADVTSSLEDFFRGYIG